MATTKKCKAHFIRTRLILVNLSLLHGVSILLSIQIMTLRSNTFSSLRYIIVQGVVITFLLISTNTFSQTQKTIEMKNSVILSKYSLDFQWPVEDPFIFCANHDDDFPKGNEKMEPDVTLKGRNIGSDFDVKDGWRMYHGDRIPGFPVHPHRGFETITIVLEGTVDHFDSMGGSGRYGNGDVQWMTAGEGMQHSEMFPLLNMDKRNPLKLFQIWINLPARSKFCKPYYVMFWNGDMPVVREKDIKGSLTQITVIAGAYNNEKAPAPPPDSWASDPGSQVSIFHITMDAGAEFYLPSSSQGLNRNIYYYSGTNITIDNQIIDPMTGLKIDSESKVLIKNGDSKSKILFMEGKPVNEPVVQRGPFVMNTMEEIDKAYSDYRRTQFGGWPWEQRGPVHKRDQGKCAILPENTD